MCLSDRSNVYVGALLAKMNLSFKHFIFALFTCALPS